MDKFLETVMNFINENTTLLIIICVFLIFVLIGYLIDNSIKTKKMQKALTEMDQTEDKVIESSELEEKNESVEPVKEETKFDSISLVDEKVEPKEEVKVETPVEPTVEVNTPEEVSTPTIEEKVEEPKFTNKKSLSEILSKKKESININDTDKTLEETTEFNNTF